LNLALSRRMNSEANNNEELWQAVLAKDTRFDGSFVFAVSSTGIYCRPSCPSRRPRRERVAFFNLPEAAEQAGFRACLRCHPKEATVEPHVQMVRTACRFIEEHQDGNLNLDLLGQHVGLSSFHLQRTFKHIMGITPRQYAEARRADKFKKGVRQGESLTNAMYDAGYGSSSRLYERATAELGMTPATYGREGRGANINYAIAPSPLGSLLVAATEKGICAVRLGESESALESNLRDEFPAADIRRGNGQLRDAVNAIVNHLSGKQPHLDLPLDIRATAFQRRVWEALRAIPYGTTRSYSQVAKAIGRPTAVRAVARACATNPVALLIPCHRVVREDQSLGGYRWGIERKKKLLAQEQLIGKQSRRA
jgi:AraC family transcriptional regulator, regulatory protein of adaptative response / methylated-DNA-[protein]-cysteine methyltransferase